MLLLSVRRVRYAAAVLDRGPLECHESTVVDRSVLHDAGAHISPRERKFRQHGRAVGEAADPRHGR